MLAPLASRNLKNSGLRHVSLTSQRGLHSYSSIKSTSRASSIFLSPSTTAPRNVISPLAINLQSKRSFSLNPFSSSSSSSSSPNSEKKSDGEDISTAPANTESLTEPTSNQSITDSAVNASELASNSTTQIEQTASAVQILKDSGLTEGHAITGSIQKLICYLHDFFPALPWWGTIAISVLLVRSLLFPLVVSARKDTIKMAQLTPGFEEIKTKYDKAVQERRLEKAQVYRQEMTEYYLKKHKFNPLRIVRLPLIQVSFFLPFFFAVRRMAEECFPGFSTGGFGWVTDLTLADPYYILPAISAGTTLLVIETGAEFGSNPNSKKMLPFFRGLVAIGAFAMSYFPAAVLCYWSTSNFFALGQALLFKNKKFRDLCNIPDNPPPRPPKLNAEGKEEGFWEGFKSGAGLDERLKKSKKDYSRKHLYGQRK